MLVFTVVLIDSNFEVKPLTAQLAINFHQLSISYTNHGNKIVDALMIATQHQQMQQEKRKCKIFEKATRLFSEIQMFFMHTFIDMFD